MEEHRSDFFSAAGKGYPDDKQLNNLSSAAHASKVQGATPESKIRYYHFMPEQTTFGSDRYLFTFTGRADASSKFAPDNQYGFSPRELLHGEYRKRTFWKERSGLMK